MKPESQLLCVHLRRWSIDRLLRRQPGLRHKPLVLVDTRNTRQLVTALSPQVPHHVLPGMTLAQALAHDSALHHAPADPLADRRALEALARWLMRFSPNVALDPPASIFLDASGLDRLFGNLASLCVQITQALARLHISAAVAAAPTPGAAWALAWGSDNTPGVPTVSGGGGGVGGGPEQILAALAPLPPDALRLDPLVTQQLWNLGLNTVQLLLAVPRLQLVSRFGHGILHRIDQVSGIEPQPLTWLPHRTPIVAEVEFEGTVESLEVVHLALQQLLQQIAQELARRQQGARQLQITFRRPYAPSLEKSVHLTRASRDPAAMFKLLQVALETLETYDGFISLQLAAPRLEPLGHRQRPLLGSEAEDRSAAVDHLIERLTARLDQGIERAEPVESYVPEKAYVCANPNDETETRGGNPKSEIRNPNEIRMTKSETKPRCIAPSPGPPGEASGSGDCPRAGRGEDDIEPATVLALSNHPHPAHRRCAHRRCAHRRCLPEYRERESEWESSEFNLRISSLRALNTCGTGVSPVVFALENAHGRDAHATFQSSPFGFDSDFGFRISDFPPPTRPLRLLPLPREIAVILRPSDRADGKPVAFTDQGETHRLSQVTGPERIAGQWWNGHWKTRDYYNVQDEHGRRHWLFCVAETRRWFVHGVFE